MLQNATTLDIVAVHTEENEPLKIWGDLLCIQFGSIASLASPRTPPRPISSTAGGALSVVGSGFQCGDAATCLWVTSKRFAIESYSDFSAKWSNFRGLVLGDINADFCNQILIFWSIFRDLGDFQSFAPFGAENLRKLLSVIFLSIILQNSQNAIFQHCSSNFPPILMKFSQNFAKYPRKWWKILNFLNFE